MSHQMGSEYVQCDLKVAMHVLASLSAPELRRLPNPDAGAHQCRGGAGLVFPPKTFYEPEFCPSFPPHPGARGLLPLGQDSNGGSAYWLTEGPAPTIGP